MILFSNLDAVMPRVQYIQPKLLRKRRERRAAASARGSALWPPRPLRLMPAAGAVRRKRAGPRAHAAPPSSAAQAGSDGGIAVARHLSALARQLELAETNRREAYRSAATGQLRQRCTMSLKGDVGATQLGWPHDRGVYNLRSRTNQRVVC